MVDIFKSYISAMDRQIEHKRFNPNLTTGEFNALSEIEKSEWDKQLLDYWDDRAANKNFAEDREDKAEGDMWA